MDAGHPADLDPVPGQRFPVDGEAAGGAVRAVGGGEHPAVGEPGRGAGQHRVDPVGVGGAGQLAGTAGGRVGGEQQDATLEPVLDGQQDLPFRRVIGRPVGVGDVRVRLGVPVEPHPGAVEPEHPQLDVGVGPARLGVREVLGRELGVRGVGEVAPLEGGFVDAGGEQGLPVGGPPVAPAPVQLLGGGELRHAPAGSVGGADPAARVGVQGVVGDVGGAGAVGVEPRVEGGSGGRNLLDRATALVPDPVQPPVQREHRAAAVAGERVRADPGGDQPDPLPQPALGGRQDARLGGQLAGVGEAGLGAGGGVQDPEAVEGVGGAGGAEEPEQPAVVPEGERARGAVREAAGARGEPEEVIHDRSVSCEMAHCTCHAA